MKLEELKPADGSRKKCKTRGAGHRLRARKDLLQRT